MYSLRLFSKLPSPKKLAYEEYEGEEFGIGGDDGAESSAATPRLAFVTTRRETGSDDLSPPKPIHGNGGGHVNEFDLSPPKTIQRGRKRTPASIMGIGDTVSEAAKREQVAAHTPVRAAKRKTKLTWQSRQSPDKHKNPQHRRSPSLTRGQSDNSRLGSASDAAAIKSLRLSASFSEISGKESGLNNGKSGQLLDKEGVGNMPFTPLVLRKKPVNSELTSSINSIDSIISIATPRSASRSRNGSTSSTANPVGGTRATGAVGKGARALFQNQQAVHLTTNSQFQLDVDPTFWQDHSVQVLIRIRPINSSEAAQQGHGRCVKQETAHTLTWLGQPETRFTFDHVASDSISQEELFRVAGLPMVENCMAGYNSCMFAYGQTGSGKTHTMLGGISDLGHQPSDNRGMTPRVFESLFTKIKLAEEEQNHENLKFKCRCSFLEIYNEQIADLLEPSSSNLQMREDVNKGVYVEGLMEVEVHNVQDVLHLLLLGAANRRVAATNMNKESSRSHSVFTCIIESQWECDQMINFRFGRLNLVDLAGSERQRASGAEGERLKEASSINKSLSTLGLVIMVLVDTANGKQRHVPYRDSKLTFLLQDSLGGNSKTTIIANISPSSCASLETLSTLKFAQRAKFIRNNAIINEDTAGDMNGLRLQIQQLKDELARLRRQSISRIPTVRASEVFREEAIHEGSPTSSNEGLNSPIQGSFLHFGRTVQSPTVLNKKSSDIGNLLVLRAQIQSLEAVLAGALRREQATESSVNRSAAEIEHLTRLVKQHEEETQCSKMILRFREDKIRRLEVLSDGAVSTDAYLEEEKDAALKELQLMRDEKACNPEVMRFAMENMRLQEQLRKFQDFHNGGEREAMTQEISDLRDQLVDVLDSKLSLDSLAHSQKDASAVELAAEKRQQELLRLEVESYRRDLEECRNSLTACLTSNDGMGRQLVGLRKELEYANEACGNYKKGLQDLQEKALEVDCLELKQAQHQQYLFQVKLQLRKSEEKAEEEAKMRIQLENQLKEALQESTNLQTELQWTKNSLDTTEVLMEKLQQNQLYPQVGVDQSREFELNQQAHIINQLQLELGELKATLEDELVRGRGLKEQLVHYGKQEGRWLRTHESVESSESHDSEGRTRVKHHDAILQLQMELDTIDGAPESAIKSYRWEEGTRDTDETKDTEVKHSMTIMQLQLDLESAESALEMERKCVKKVEASRARLQKQLEETVEREAAAREDVAGLSRLLEEKEFEISTLQQDWENAAAKLIDYLAAGKFSFDAACSISIHELFTTSLLLGKNMTTDRMVCKVLEKQTAVTNLCKQLQDVRKLANSLASKLQELKKFALDDGQVYSSGTDVVIDEQDKESMLQAHQDSMALKVEVESCDAYIQEVESKSTMAFIMVWWLSETASLRCVDEDRIQERQGILFSLQLEHRKTPEKESRALQYKAQQELAALEDERKRLAAKNLRFEIQVGEIVNILEYLDVQIGTVKERLHRVNEKSSDVAKAQSSLTIVKVNWNLEVSSLVKATTEAEQRYTELKEELSVAKDELQRLEARTPAGETREYELQNERAKAEKELKEHLEAVQVLADDLRSQIELKEEENNKLKEQMAEQYEDWVLEKSELLVATQDSESRCIEKDQTITTLQRTMSKLQGQLSGAGHKPRVPKGKMYRLPEDEVDLQLEDRAEELKEAIDRLTAENLELRNEKLFFSKNTGKKIQMVAQKEEESSVMQKRLLDAEEHQKQAELKVQALTLLIEEFTCSQESWLSEKEFLKAEVERLQSCLENMNLEFQSCQKERDTCVKRLAQIEENKELLENHANNTPSNGVKNAHADLRKARAALASSEEKVKLLTDMVSSIGEDWAGERQNLISENEDLRVELARWEQHTDVRRSSDQPLRHLSENRSIPADASSYNKNVDKLRQDLEKMRTETANLRSRIREQDQAYLSVRMELSVSLAKRKDLEVELDRMAAGSQHLLLKDIDTREQIDGSSLEVSRQHAHIQSCESELERLTMLLLESEEQMNATKQAWREEKTRLEAGREEAQLEASETRNEAGAMLVKFEEWKTTLREADAMVNALVRVNEKAKERWKREKEQLASTQIEETNKVVQEMLEAVALTKEQFEMTKGHAQGELCALISEIQILRLDMTHETLKLKREMPGNVHYNSGSVELLPSAKCLDSERRSWEHQIKAASLVLSHKETAIRMLQAEVEKCQKQTVDVQTLHSSTQLLLQEKEKMVLKLVNELNHLNQTMNRDRTLRQSLTRDVDNVTSLRRSFSCKVAEEKDSTLSVLKEEQEQLKTMVFNLEVENAELQQQLLEAEARSKALESTIDHLQRSDDRWFEKVQLLEEQLEESARHVSELESQRMELRDEMQRQAVTFAELHEQLQKQEGALEGEARAIANKVAAEKEVLHTLKEEKAELKSMVERLDAELTLYEKKASRAERSQAELERLELEMEGLQKELFRIESLQKEIEVQNAKLETMSFQSTKLEVDLASKNKELSVIVKELKATRVSADLATHECNELKCQVQELLEKASALEVEITRKRTAIKAVEAELLAVQETMARCLEDASIDLRELEIERDNLQVELSTLNEQLQATQALAEEQTAIAVEARQNSELSRTRAEEKQVEAEILGKSVVELESTVYALESQLGLVKRESERQRLIREDIEMELQGLKNHMSVLQAALEEAGARSTDDILEVQLAREEAERKLEEKDAVMQLVRKKLEKLQKDSEAKAEKIRLSKAQISDLLAEAERKAAKYEEKLKAVEIKLEERVNSQPTVSKGPKLKGAGSTFACIGMGHQVNSEFNAEQQMYERRIQELETDLSDQQREVCILNRKLGAAERMTREVLQDLLGVKSDMTNVASLLGQQQEEQNSLQSQKESSEKDEEVERLLQQLNEFIEERESWLEEISRRQSDLVAAQGAIDKMQERERVLCIENENIKGELRTQQKITGNLDQEVKNLSGQQNPQQRIKHHAKIKDENNLLRIQNDELSGKLRRAELLHARVGDELTKYRIAEGKTATLNFDEEQRLRTKVQELEEQKVDLSQNLANLCARIMETAGIVEPNRNGELAVALEALRQIKIRLDSTQIELEDCRLKIKIVEEKQRLNELRIVHSPMKGNFGVECLTPR